MNSDIEIGRQIVTALTRARIPVSVYLWAFVPQLQEWQFIIATPLVDSKGPLAAYGEVNRVLRKEGLFDDTPLKRVFLRSPSDRVLKSLEKESRAVPQESFRIVNEQIAGNFVEDAYVYGGSIFIVKAGSSRPDPREYYSIIYSPRSGPRPPAPQLRKTIEEVQQFLEEGLRMDKHTVDLQIAKLRTGQSALIPVSLTPHQLRDLELA
ncbi:MAG TPA: hypothetical protein VN948_14905 [Terriglobales bacterium]|nr:hypothetical protein [Terriglobales bacterium]